MRIGVTATRRLDPTGERNIRDALRRARGGLHGMKIEAVITGGAVGGDAFAARAATALGLWVRTLLPEDPKEIDPDWADYCNEATVVGPYRARNTEIVAQCDVLYAFPDHDEDHPASKRSGTWMTVRIARKQGVPVRVWPQHLAG